MRTVLITGARAPIALDLARSFAAAGWEPHLADSIHAWGARFAEVAKGRFHRLASPRYAFETFVAEFGALVAHLDPELIVPTCEEVFYVAAAGRRLGLSERVFAPSPEVLRQLHSKVDFAELARDCGISAPTTRRVIGRADLEPWRSRTSALVFKPEFSRFASHTLVRPTPRAMDGIAPTPEEPWAVQDFVDGEELCLWSAAIKGEIVAFAAYKPLWRLGRSASFYFETAPDPALIEIPRAIAHATGATGQLSFDVIRQADGRIVPIECNPRGISGLHLFDSHPRLAIALAGGGALVLPDTEARHLAPAMWLLGAPSALFQGRWRAFRRDLQRGGDVLALSGDRWATLGALLDAVRFWAVGLSRGRSASGQTTDDIEWNGELIG